MPLCPWRSDASSRSFHVPSPSAEMRLSDNMGPSAQTYVASHPSLQQQAQQLHQQAAQQAAQQGTPIPNFLQFQHQAANASPQYMQQATAAHFIQQQNAALQAQLPALLAQQSPLLAQQALVQNVYNKYGTWQPSWPPIFWVHEPHD